MSVEAKGNFEVVKIDQKGRRARNVIIMLGDGMGIAHRTAARIVAFGAQQGKANDRLEMDKFPYTGLVMTHSLNSIVTDSAPGMACYSSGNKANNNQEGVFPDDTTDPFDNPRVEYMGEFLHRTQGKSLGLVTTADVFDATPAANAIHTSDRGAGTGICDQYLDESGNNGLSVLLGGGRKWFLPKGTAGSVRANGNDYKLPAELATAWGVPTGAKDETRDLLGDFQTAGWTYAANRTDLDGAPPATTKLLGLFSFSNMNIAKDKIDGRRGVVPPGSATGNPVVSDYGFPDQPLLEEMTAKALTVLNKNPQGFVLMVEGASIDKQAHNMDSERWILDTIEFDHAVGVVRKFVEANPDTLVVITADHECSGANIIGASTKKAADLAATASADLRKLVGTYDLAGFPSYSIAADGYPTTTEPDYKLLIGYAANADRYEDWQTNPFPAHDSQQPFDTVAPLSGYPRINSSDNSGAVNPLRPIRDVATGFPITGHVDGNQAVHTASDIPCSALGRGASQFTGVLDNTDLFFRMLQAAVGGAL